MASVYRVAIESHSSKEVPPESIPFSSGNPSVEHVTGVLRLYRPLEADDVSAQTRQAEQTADQVCVLAVPTDMSFKDFCQFLGSYPAHVNSIWMVRREDTASSVCMPLLTFKSAQSAHNFVEDYNGQPFSVLEPDIICRCVLISSIEIITGVEELAMAGVLQPPTGHAELPTCPVCLERLDEHISGIITTVCNHKFHNECLQKWGDASCPVCRYCMSGHSSSRCEVCEASVDLWICLICGHVGCGRYREAHARDHYEMTNHCYSLEMETGRVWDYVGDGYVHRLIQSHVDGKLVEVPAPASSGRRTSMACHPGHSSDSGDAQKSGGQRGRPARSADAVPEEHASHEEMHMMEAMYASKMDAVTREYNHLLANQLESQRQYFEELRAQDQAESSRRLQEVEQRLVSHAATAAAATERSRAAECQAKGLEKRMKDLEVRNKELCKEVDTLAELNKCLIANQKAYRDKQDATQKACEEKESRIRDLQEQVRDMMVYIEASQMVQSGDSELSGGSVAVGPSQQGRGRHGRKR